MFVLEFISPILLLAIFVTDAQRLLDIDNSRIITRHTQYRKVSGGADTHALRWSPKLYKIATELAATCPQSTDNLNGEIFPVDVGVNIGFNPIAMDTALPRDMYTKVVDTWGLQRANYKPSTGCTKDSCDEWIQMVWAKTYKLGCGLAQCGSQATLVCLYKQKSDPSKPAYIEGTACSKCPDNMSCKESFCYSGDEADADEITELGEPEIPKLVTKTTADPEPEEKKETEPSSIQEANTERNKAVLINEEEDEPVGEVTSGIEVLRTSFMLAAAGIMLLQVW